MPEENYLKRKGQTTESAIESSFGAARGINTFFEDDVNHKRIAKHRRDVKQKERIARSVERKEI